MTLQRHKSDEWFRRWAKIALNKKKNLCGLQTSSKWYTGNATVQILSSSCSSSNTSAEHRDDGLNIGNPMRMLLVSGLIWHTSFGLKCVKWSVDPLASWLPEVKHALHSQVHRSSGRSINNHSLTQTVCKYCCLISEHRLPKHCNQNKSANFSFCKRGLNSAGCPLYCIQAI